MRDFHRPGRSPVLATNGMVATSHPLAAQVGIETLQAGGNAMDAALASAVLLGFCEPQMTGLFGDMFVLVQRNADAPVEAFNGSGRAPDSANAAALRDAGHQVIPIDSPDSITLAGAIDAVCSLSQSHGTLGLDRILAPATKYATLGIPVAPRVAQDWASNADRLQGHARRWYLKDDRALQVGDIFKAPGQAKVLEEVAKHGAAGFYEGPVGADILATLQTLGGGHTAEDLAATKGQVTRPISGDAFGHTLFEHPPNGQGATALLIMNILSQFDMASMDPHGAERVHLETEATKLAYAARNKLVADPDYYDATEKMCDPDFAKDLAGRIDMNKAMPMPAPLPHTMHKDTVYLSSVDKDGMAVSLIYSIFHGFGSGHATEEYGLILHNRGAGFSLEEGHPNEYGPGKRPMHTIIPGLLHERDGTRMPFGVMGGQYQPAGHARVLANMHVYGMEPQSALDAPRSFPESGQLQMERGYGDDVRSDLAAKGHAIVTPDGAIGGAQAIRIHPSGVLEGASDPRKDGCALGY
ncbi:MAG: gamma-glutamyltransferase family protein [Marinovum sp.]|nr:gamma-glutamyltransferase family protein [Marinovum sp.]